MRLIFFTNDHNYIYVYIYYNGTEDQRLEPSGAALGVASDDDVSGLRLQVVVDVDGAGDVCLRQPYSLVLAEARWEYALRLEYSKRGDEVSKAASFICVLHFNRP